MEKVLLQGWGVGLWQWKCLVLQPGGLPVVQNPGALKDSGVGSSSGWPQLGSRLCFPSELGVLLPSCVWENEKQNAPAVPGAPLAGQGSASSPGDLVVGGGEDIVSIPTSVQGESELGPLAFLKQTPPVTLRCFADQKKQLL